MSAPTVVHHDREETDTAVLCADGRIHYGPEYLTRDDPERVRKAADDTAQYSPGWCGGAPHVIATRKRITTAWEPQK